jgi:hypothetical protein
MAKIKKRNIIILMGTLNAMIGKDNKGTEQIMGKHAQGKSNGNSEHFTELCGNYNLVTEGSLFPHRECHSYMGFTGQRY